MAHSNSWAAEPSRPVRATLNPPASTISEAIARLQADWHTLHFMDRAEAVNDLLKAGLSRRYVATVLHCTESILRTYLKGLQASPDDIQLAREGQIGLRELVRRANGDMRESGSTLETASYTASVTDASQGATIILEWFSAASPRQEFAWNIIKQAIALLEQNERALGLLTVRIRPAPGLDELSDACRPKRPPQFIKPGPGDTVDSLLHDLSWYGHWLPRYVVSLIGDAKICREASNRALKQVPAPGRKPKLW